MPKNYHIVGKIGVFSSGNCTVMLRAKKCRPVTAMPLNSSVSKKLLVKSLTAVKADISTVSYFQIFQGDWIHSPTTTSQTSVTGMKIFQPRRMIWS